MRRTMTVLALVVVLMGMWPAATGADGIIIPRPIPVRPDLPLRALAIKYHRVFVSIDAQVATTRVDQVFVNESPYELEGDYIFPVPAGASVTSLALWVDGERLEAQVLDSDEARRIYEDIVRQRRDPALLEYVGQNAFRARIYPIPAHGERRVELEYTEVLRYDGGLVRYVYPLATERFSTRPLEDVRVEVSIAAGRDLKAIYSPSHVVRVEREGSHRAHVVYHDEDVTPDTDFLLYYSVDDGELGLEVLSFREQAEDGFFLMLLSPGAVDEGAVVVAKDVFLVLDTSGSMRGEKMAQAQDAVRYVLNHLNAEDRFNIIAFSSTVHTFARGLQPMSERDEALRFINRLAARGGTNIHQALVDTLQQTEAGRPQVVLFLTDGLATEGEVRTGEIVAAVADLAQDDLRFFAFGVGYDVNTILLDTLGQAHHGTSIYVQPGEDIERAVSSLYDKISMPVLTDLNVDYGHARVHDVYPHPLPDIFAGGQVVVVGRYPEGGTTQITLEGTRDGERLTYVYQKVTLTEGGGDETVPRLWATRKIGHLLTQIRLHGPDGELVDEIIDLSVRYGIVTPYTSFLVDETEDALSAEGRRDLSSRALAPEAHGWAQDDRSGAMAPLAVSGQAAVEKAVAQEALRSADGAAELQSERVVHVGPKAFVLRDDVWVDTVYDTGSMSSRRIEFGSAAYMGLLSEDPGIGRYLALGQRLILVWEGQAYEITPDAVTPEAAESLAPGQALIAWLERVRQWLLGLEAR